MLCPKCGKETANDSVYCDSCQQQTQDELNSAPVSDPMPASGASLLAKIAIAVPVLLALVYAFSVPAPHPDPARASGYRTGIVIGSLLVPALLAYVIAGRRKKRNLNRFAVIFLISGCIWVSLSWYGALNSETPEQRVGRLMREAAGTQPVRNSSIARRRQFDDAVREQFRNLIQQNREYADAVDKLDVSETSKLNTPETLADTGSAAEALKQLQASFDLDTQQEQRVTQIVDNLRLAMQQGASSQIEKEAILKGFDKGVALHAPKRKELITTEKAWVDAENDLYNFATQHHDELRLENDKIVIANEGVREEFNKKINLEEDSRKQFLKTKEAFSQDQVTMLQRLSVDPKTVGPQ